MREVASGRVLVGEMSGVDQTHVDRETFVAVVEDGEGVGYDLPLHVAGRFPGRSRARTPAEALSLGHCGVARSDASREARLENCAAMPGQLAERGNDVLTSLEHRSDTGAVGEGDDARDESLAEVRRR